MKYRMKYKNEIHQFENYSELLEFFSKAYKYKDWNTVCGLSIETAQKIKDMIKTYQMSGIIKKIKAED